MDVKCPGSGESGSFRVSNLDCLTDRDEVKFVIANRGDYEFARDFIREHKPETRAGADSAFAGVLQRRPSTERTTENCLLDPRELVEWMLADALPARLSLQIHKYVWEPQKKGV